MTCLSTSTCELRGRLCGVRGEVLPEVLSWRLAGKPTGFFHPAVNHDRRFYPFEKNSGLFWTPLAEGQS